MAMVLAGTECLWRTPSTHQFLWTYGKIFVVAPPHKETSSTVPLCGKNKTQELRTRTYRARFNV